MYKVIYIYKALIYIKYEIKKELFYSTGKSSLLNIL